MRYQVIRLALAMCVFPFSVFGQPAVEAQTPAQAVSADRAEDAALIRAHIESIFQAFVDKDLKKLEETHSKDWRGFTTGSRRVIRGVDGYMRSATAGARLAKGQGMVGFKIPEFDVVFYGDTAVASLVADLEMMNGTTPGSQKLVIVDVYRKEPGGWNQVATNTSYHPDYLQESAQRQMATLRSLSEPERASLLEARESVWRAWFTGDITSLRQLLPEELITLGGSMSEWGTLASNMRGAEGSGKAGTTIRRLEFPRTEIQTYGLTAVIYTSYSLETERNGQVQSQEGLATEIFVWRDGRWVNTGWQLAPLGR